MAEHGESQSVLPICFDVIDGSKKIFRYLGEETDLNLRSSLVKWGV